MIILYLICFLGLLHTYILYPLILKILAKGKKNNTDFYENELPMVSVLMAAYNEELVIEKKIESILACDYPIEKLNIFIGSDNSSDRTNAIVQQFSQSNIYFKNFNSRQGKPSIVNQTQ